jgi:hypothetical protein
MKGFTEKSSAFWQTGRGVSFMFLAGLSEWSGSTQNCYFLSSQVK